MKIPIPKDECRQLVDFIESLGPTEWRKSTASEYVIRSAVGWEIGSQIECPPEILFRFEQDKPEVISLLRRAILSYRGMVSWVLQDFDRGSGRRSNWVIMPRRLLEVEQKAQDLEISSRKYMTRYEPEFGAIAYRDMAGLTEHVINFFEHLDSKKRDS